MTAFEAVLCTSLSISVSCHVLMWRYVRQTRDYMHAVAQQLVRERRTMAEYRDRFLAHLEGCDP